MKTAPLWEAGPEAQKQKQNSEANYSADLAPLQAHPAAEASLHRLAHYRAALDGWLTAGGEGEMPQPKDYGVRLPDLEPGQVWRAA